MEVGAKTDCAGILYESFDPRKSDCFKLAVSEQRARRYLDIQEKPLAMAKESATTTASESDTRLTTAKESTMGAKLAEKASTAVKSAATEASEINVEPEPMEGSAIDTDVGTDEESTAVASESEEELRTAEENIADEASQELDIDEDFESDGLATAEGSTADEVSQKLGSNEDSENEELAAKEPATTSTSSKEAPVRITAKFVGDNYKLVQFSTSDKNGVVDIGNIKVITAGQGKKLFSSRPEYGCTMEIPDYLGKAMLSEFANQGLSGDTLTVPTMIFECKLVEDTKFESVDPHQFVAADFRKYSNIPSLSDKYPNGFMMSGKFSFIFAERYPFAINVKVHSGTITSSD